MQRDKEDRRVVPKGVLRAVAMMDIPVEHHDALDTAALGMAHRDDDVVEHAEPHAPVAHRMVTGRAHQAERVTRATVEHRIGEFDRCTSGEDRCFPGAWYHRRLRIEPAATFARHAPHVRDVVARVVDGQLVLGRWSWRDEERVIEQARCSEQLCGPPNDARTGGVLDRLEHRAVRELVRIEAGVVLQETFVVAVRETHRSSSSTAEACSRAG
ncbi:hypothetical protein HRbin27_01280 [bacterium HR27]|nr:hypothetical protein HRbin27_01280 [bacterium HR27]